MKKKATIVITALALVLCFAVGGTLAWLKAETTSVVNTFTYGDININLDESDVDNDGDNKKNNYKMVPGNVISKDPKVTVEAGSEDCWLFVKIDKSGNYDTYLEDYTVADGWYALEGEDGVFYREAKAGDSFYVLGADEKNICPNGCVTVKTSVTKSQMALIKDSGMPTLTFTAYAVQKDNVDSAAEAWLIATGQN